jgi:Lar family restriction alleviation protein
MKLLPCPFCGGKATIIRSEFYGWSVTCQECNIVVPSSKYDGYDLARHAADNWNTRYDKDGAELQT